MYMYLPTMSIPIPNSAALRSWAWPNPPEYTWQRTMPRLWVTCRGGVISAHGQVLKQFSAEVANMTFKFVDGPTSKDRYVSPLKLIGNIYLGRPRFFLFDSQPHFFFSFCQRGQMSRKRERESLYYHVSLSCVKSGIQDGP